MWNRPIAAAGAGARSAVDPLDALYGVASLPAYIKHYEADRDGKIVLNPYLQVATKDFPAILDSKQAPYNWVIDEEGRVTVVPEANHPLGRTYPNGFVRPEDNSKKKPGTREAFGHVSSTGGRPGRISGEILWDKESKSWVVNNKSGRYSKHNNHPVINAIKEFEAASETEDHDRISASIMQMDELGAWDFDTKVKQVLGKLNIHHLEQPVKTLSGGQRKRVALAKTLIDIGFEHKHVLLIMDEPTNHLDVEMVEWLEHYLDKENVTLLCRRSSPSTPSWAEAGRPHPP